MKVLKDLKTKILCQKQQIINIHKQDNTRLCRGKDPKSVLAEKFSKKHL